MTQTHLKKVRRASLTLNLFTMALIQTLLLSSQPASAFSVDEKSAHNLFALSCRNSLNPKTRALAIQQITEAIRLAPKNSLYIYQKAYYLSISEEDDDEALKLLEKVLAVNSKSAESWALKSDILLRHGKAQEALKAADRSTSLNTRFFMTRLRSLQRLKRREEALAECEKYLKIYPQDAILLSIHSDLARQSQKWHIVIDDETKMLALSNPKESSYFTHLKNRAAAYVATKQDDRAMRDLEEVMKHLRIDRQAPAELLQIYKRKKDAKNIARIEAYLRELDEDMKP